MIEELPTKKTQTGRLSAPFFPFMSGFIASVCERSVPGDSSVILSYLPTYLKRRSEDKEEKAACCLHRRLTRWEETENGLFLFEGVRSRRYCRFVQMTITLTYYGCILERLRGIMTQFKDSARLVGAWSVPLAQLDCCNNYCDFYINVNKKWNKDGRGRCYSCGAGCIFESYEPQ